ncbi:MAG: CHASE domain-containing protein [Magnetococcales bacterium]|nr:CHASE domain-containing protein [Magnetococcales bacterium]
MKRNGHINDLKKKWNLIIFSVFVAGMTLTVAGAYLTHKLVREIWKGSFEKGAFERFETIKGGFSQILNAVEDVRGLFEASNEVDRSEFMKFTQPMIIRHRGLQALSWNPVVPNAMMSTFERAASEDAPGFKVTQYPFREHSLESEPTRDYRIVVLFIEPKEGNERAMGCDIASEPIRMAAIREARDSGRPAITAKIKLAQAEETDSGLGLLILHPVYQKGTVLDTAEQRRKHLTGFAVGVVHIGKMIESSISYLAPRGITFWLNDLSSPKEEQPLYVHISRIFATKNNHSETYDISQFHENPLRFVRNFTVANRDFQFVAIQHRGGAGERHLEYWSIYYVIIIGVMLTSSLLLYILRLKKDEHRRAILCKQIRDSEILTRTILENAPFCIVVADQNSMIQIFNGAAQRLFGYDHTEVIGHPLITLIPHALREQHDAGFLRHMKTGEERIIGAGPLETKALHKDGTIFPVRLAINRMEIEESHPSFVGIIVDITEEKRMRAEMVQTEKMAGLGNMVAGVAHEINTPVGIGVTAASELSERTHNFANMVHTCGITEEELEDYLASTNRLTYLIQSNLERSAELIRSFKSVAVDQSCESKRAFKVKQCVESTVTMLLHELKRTQLVIVVLCPDDLEIKSYPGALTQIILNLLNNSRIHGYPENSSGQIKIEFSSYNGNLLFTYQDNGRGMTEIERQRLYEPFFTTNRDHGGSGLGMHVVYNLVTQTLAGTITCVSSPGKGVLFKIVLPIHETTPVQRGPCA